MQPSTRRSLAYILGVVEGGSVGKYLGIPSMVGRIKKEVFNYVRDCICKRISS